MIKAIFFDIDGTLVPFDHKVLSDQLLKDLPALRERGIKIFICSGRAFQDLKKTGMLRDVEFDGYLTLNGQCCFDGEGVYRDVPICHEDLEAACRVLREHPHLAALMQGDGVSHLSTINDRVREIHRFLHTEMSTVRDPEWMLTAKIYQFVPMVGPEEEKLFLPVMPHCTHTRWHPKGIDIVPGGGGKGAGVRAAMERYGFARDEIMAFGDGENDMSMMAQAGTSVAMGNGEDRVKAMADYVTDSAENGGVSKALRHFGLLPE